MKKKDGEKREEKKEEGKIFSQKPEKTVGEIQEEKNAFYKFMNREQGLNKTVGGSGTKYRGLYTSTNKKVEQPSIGTPKK